jgi:hypothetical protein
MISLADVMHTLLRKISGSIRLCELGIDCTKVIKQDEGRNSFA